MIGNMAFYVGDYMNHVTFKVLHDTVFLVIFFNNVDGMLLKTNFPWPLTYVSILIFLFQAPTILE